MKKITAKTVNYFLYAIIALIVVLYLVRNFSVNKEISDDYEYKLLPNGTAEITRYTGEDIYLEIPSKLFGYRVTSIGISAFYDCTTLTEIIIPDSVTLLDDAAFGGCSNLTKITIPDSVTSIGWKVFGGCTSLKEITLPNNITSIEPYTFSNSGLVKITIPDKVTSIGYDAFFSCSNLTDITIPDSVTSIAGDAFFRCSSLTDITIPDSVTSIEWSAFMSCTGLTELTIPNSVTLIGNRAIGYEYIDKDNYVKIPDFIIYGYSGSAAEIYAKENDILFSPISEIIPAETITSSATENKNDIEDTKPLLIIIVSIVVVIGVISFIFYKKKRR